MDFKALEYGDFGVFTEFRIAVQGRSQDIFPRGGGGGGVQCWRVFCTNFFKDLHITISPISYSCHIIMF